MSSNIYVYDPTVSDKLSKVRGIGRYLQIFKENFSKDFIFTDKFKEVPDHAVFINPFFNLVKRPLRIRRISRRQVAVIHDLIPLKFPEHYPAGVKGSIYQRLNHVALKRYDMIVTDSEATKKDIVNILTIPEKKVQVVYPILSKNFFEKKAVKPKHIEVPENYLLYVADATWNKNLVNIAKAIKLNNTPCVFVGNVFMTFLKKNLNEIHHPEQQELKNFLIEAKNDPRFIFTGFISDEELIYLYQHAAANILISHDEGFGYSYLEAASLRIPSLLADRPIFHETAQNTALFADPEIPNEIAKKMKQISGDKELQKKLGLKAFERSKEFSQERFRTKILDLVQNNEYYDET